MSEWWDLPIGAAWVDPSGGKPFVRVDREAFRSFLKNYPNKIEHHCTTICDPENHGYYDFSLPDLPGQPGSIEHAFRAKQAFCVYGDERDPEDRFFVRDANRENASQ